MLSIASGVPAIDSSAKPLNAKEMLPKGKIEEGSSGKI
jgi:hypothetical protein